MSLRRYLAKRVLIALFVLWIIVSLNFLIFEIFLPMKPHRLNVSLKTSPKVREALAELWGLNRPIYIRYLKYVLNMFTWNFGVSLHTMTPIAEEMAWRLSVTVLLLGPTFTVTIFIGITVGILAASRRGSKVDVLTISSGLFTWAIPFFFTQLLFLLVFSYHLYATFGFAVFPIRGITDTIPTDPLTYMADLAWHLFLPVLTNVLASFGPWALVTRNVLLDALTQDYIVTARAKGLSERTVLYRHALRGTMPPIVTMITMSIPGIIGGSVITEMIFSLPGIGMWFLRGLNGADYPVIESVLYVFAVLTVFTNLITDFIYGVLDPRIRLGERAR